MNRPDLLDAAKGYVTRDRNSSYDEPEANFGRIAALWAAWDSIKGPRVSPEMDVAVKMALLKIGRLAFDPSNADSWADAIGYLACGGEIATEQP